MLTQGGKTCSTHLDTTKSLIDQLVVAGKHVDDQNLINFLLINLQSSYTPFVTSFNFASRDTEFTFEDFQIELVGFENLLKINQTAPTSNNGHFIFTALYKEAKTIQLSCSIIYHIYYFTSSENSSHLSCL